MTSCSRRYSGSPAAPPSPCTLSSAAAAPPANPTSPSRRPAPTAPSSFPSTPSPTSSSTSSSSGWRPTTYCGASSTFSTATSSPRPGTARIASPAYPRRRLGARRARAPWSRRRCTTRDIEPSNTRVVPRRHISTARLAASWPAARLAKAPPLAISSSYVPRSATPPSRTSRIWSALRIVESLCAITSTVRPLMTRSKATWTSRSETGSRLDDASSSTRIFGFLRIARAIAIRCRWPPSHQ